MVSKICSTGICHVTFNNNNNNNLIRVINYNDYRIKYMFRVNTNIIYSSSVGQGREEYYDIVNGSEIKNKNQNSMFDVRDDVLRHPNK